MKVYKYQIESFLVLISCLNVAYLNTIIGRLPTFLFMFRVIMLGCVICNIIVSKKKLSKTTINLLVFSGWIIFVSAIRMGNFFNAIQILSSPILISLFIEWKKNSKNIYNCLSVWYKTLFLLVILDLATMVIYPTGMYNDSVYSLNWLLGYKTARLVISLPCCVLASIVSLKKNKRINGEAIICYIVSAVSLYYSQAMAAFLGILVACIGILIVNKIPKRKLLDYLWNKVSNLKFVFLIYIIVTAIFIFVQDVPLFQYIITVIFQKDETLSARTYIWNHCMEIISQYPLCGVGYLTTLQYQELNNSIYATSAHNMLLTILVSGGVVGVFLYARVISRSSKLLKYNLTLSKKILCVAIISMLIIGITSSSVIFSLCGFMFFNLMELSDDKV